MQTLPESAQAAPALRSAPPDLRRITKIGIRFCEKSTTHPNQTLHNSNNQSAPPHPPPAAAHQRREQSRAGGAIDALRGDPCLLSEKGEGLLRGVGTLRYLFPPHASVQWQPDGLTIHTKEWFLGARFLGAPPISLTLSFAGGHGRSSRDTRV